MLLGGIYHAGRLDACSDVKLENFSKVSGHFCVENNHIKNLVQEVWDKCEDHWQRHTYILYFDDHAPELCYRRHLLVYVHCLNLLEAQGSTNLFPEKETLMSHTSSSNAASISSNAASYLEGMAWLEETVEHNLRYPANLEVGGMHTLKATFYLWGYLSKTPVRRLKKNARDEASEELVEEYIGNAEFYKRKLRDNPSLLKKQRVGLPMEDILVSPMGGNQNRIIRIN
jgi:hypothetical protein